MTKTFAPALLERTLDDLTILDEVSFQHVEIYAQLKDVLREGAYTFRTLPQAASSRWDRALLLNLTFWGGDGGDVLVDQSLPADVVAHAAWHHLAARALAEPITPSSMSLDTHAPQSAGALFLGEAIASAFDVYLVGRLLGHSPRSSFLETQVPAMADAALAAGLSEDGFAALLSGIAEDPDAAFDDLRTLLFDATRALYRAADANDGYVALANFDAHRFAPLLHRYELSNWVLYARAYADPARAEDPKVNAVDQALRQCAGDKRETPLEWLTRTWITPALSNQR